MKNMNIEIVKKETMIHFEQYFLKKLHVRILDF